MCLVRFIRSRTEHPSNKRNVNWLQKAEIRFNFLALPTITYLILKNPRNSMLWAERTERHIKMPLDVIRELFSKTELWWWFLISPGSRRINSREARLHILFIPCLFDRIFIISIENVISLSRICFADSSDSSLKHNFSEFRQITVRKDVFINKRLNIDPF